MSGELLLLPQLAKGHLNPDGVIVSADTAFLHINRNCGGADRVGTRLAIPNALRLISQAWQALIEMEAHLTLADAQSIYHYKMWARPVNEGVLLNLYKISSVNNRPSSVQREADFTRATADWIWKTDKQYHVTYVSERLYGLVRQPLDMIIGQPLTRLLDSIAGTAHKEILAHWAIGKMDSKAWEKGLVIETQAAPSKLLHIRARPLFDDHSQEHIGWLGSAIEHPLSHLPDGGLTQGRALLLDGGLKLPLGAGPDDNIKHSGHAEPTKSFGLAEPFLSADMLREPLEKIASHAGAMKRLDYGPLKGVYANYAGDILTAAKHLDGLIDDVADLAKVDSDAVDLDIDTFDLIALVDEARAILAPQAHHAGTTINWRSALGAPTLMVVGDRARMRQIIINLMLNAVKFAGHAGPIKLSIAESRADTGLSSMTGLCVDDQGTGIAEDARARIFNKFERLPENSSVEGTGLGLFISQSLARAMGGGLEVSSSPEGGARFTLWVARA